MYSTFNIMPSDVSVSPFSPPAWPLWHPPAAGAALLRGHGAARQGRRLHHGPAPSPRAPQAAPHGGKTTPAIVHENFPAMEMMVWAVFGSYRAI